MPSHTLRFCFSHRIFNLLLLIRLGLAPAMNAESKSHQRKSDNNKLRVEVVSSSADQVSGGDARIEVTSRSDLHKHHQSDKSKKSAKSQKSQIIVLVNGVDQSENFTPIGRKTLSGVVTDLRPGSNTVVVKEVMSRGHSKNPKVKNASSIELINYPISASYFQASTRKRLSALPRITVSGR